MSSRADGYFQVGGWRGHIWAPGNLASKYAEEKPLAEALTGPRSPLRSQDRPDGPVEMVLGISETGASYLLITKDEADQYTRAFNMRPIRAYPIRPDSFESLSPIYFDGVEELKNKFNWLKPRKGGKFDTSRANGHYREGNVGVARGEFELNRVFYRIVQKSLNLKKYRHLQDAVLPGSTRVCALTFSVWDPSFDTRNVTERLKIPKILDVAYAEVSLPSFDVRPDSIRHFVVKENSGLGSRKDRKPFTDGPSETLGGHEIGQHVSKFLSEGDGRNVLFVFDQEATEYALKSLGVEQVRCLNIRSLLRFMNDTGSSNRRPSRGGPSDYDQRRNRRRSRSRSPQRPSGSSTTLANRREQPSKHMESFVIDVQKLFFTMMEEQQAAERARPLSISGRLGVNMAEEPMEWGAMLEVGLLVKSWTALASGLPIDDQRVSRKNGSHISLPSDIDPAPSRNTPADGHDYDLDDLENDPNSYVPKVPASTSTRIAPANINMQEYDPDDASDYGSD